MAANSHNLERFLDATAGDPGNCILVVGAGLSKREVRENGRGLPDWDDLMRLMIEQLETSGRSESARIGQLRDWLAADPPRYLDVAEEFWKAHEHDRGGYERFLRRHLRPHDLIESPLHRLILEVGFRGIVSFNFDLVFEKLSDKLDRVVYPDLLQQLDHFRRKGFFAKIHGCIDGRADHLVLTRSSYEDLTLAPNYARLLQSLFLAHNVLCVGFSLRDPDFLGILSDLKSHVGVHLPPLYALMHDPGHEARNAWLTRGVDILPYDDHTEVTTFFKSVASLVSERNGSDHEALKPGVDGLRSSAASTGRLMNAEAQLHKEAEATGLILKKWEGESKIEEMDRVLSEELSRLATKAEKENLLVRIAALCTRRHSLHLCHHALAVGTPVCLDLVDRTMRLSASEGDLYLFKVHERHKAIHAWVVERKAWEYGGEAGEKIIYWLLQENWADVGINLTHIFTVLLDSIINHPDRENLDELYKASHSIPGATKKIEKIAFASGFIRADKWKDKGLVGEIHEYRFERQMEERKDASPAELVKLATDADEEIPHSHYSCLGLVVKRLLQQYVQLTFLGIDGSSSAYDPIHARAIVDVLASVREKDEQGRVLHEISHWLYQERRGRGPFGDDAEPVHEELLPHLWWRYSSEMRIEYLTHRRKGRRMEPMPQWTGQEFLLEGMMGLRYDPDAEFRERFNASLGVYRTDRDDGRYEPRLQQELWRGRELKYEIVDECPPELIRRIATKRIDWENSTPGETRWEESAHRAEMLLHERHGFRDRGLALQGLRDFVSAQRKDYVIENLLGSYLPQERRVVLYKRMIELGASDLGVDADALSTVVYIHETVHAFSHLGRDLSGRMWQGCSMPPPRVPEFEPSRAMEAIAQFYAYKLLERLGDQRLLDAFVKLEAHSDPIYAEWRKTEHYTLEAMRALLMRFRDAETEWPPPRG